MVFMSNSVIKISVQASPSQAGVDLPGTLSSATIEFFDSYQPVQSVGVVSIQAIDSVSVKDLAGSLPDGIGNLRCVSLACISDATVYESASAIANVDPGLLASIDPATGVSMMSSPDTSFESLNSNLLDAMPRLKMALDGQLTHSELSQLIVDMQAQVLELNTLSQTLYGDLSGEVADRIADLQADGSDSLLVSMQLDSSLFAQPLVDDAAYASLSSAATLDALFTSPEAFPLTLDFSNSSSVQAASELFVSAGSLSSSISSSANATDTDNGSAGIGSSSGDFT